VIFGYATGNDFTARDLQSRSSQWMLGKALDGSAPVGGPWLVTADLADGDNLKIECRVNGEVRQSSNTADMVFTASSSSPTRRATFTLKPGDMIFTGTPEGVIFRLSEGQAGVAEGRRQAHHLDREARRPGIQADVIGRATRPPRRGTSPRRFVWRKRLPQMTNLPCAGCKRVTARPH